MPAGKTLRADVRPLGGLDLTSPPGAAAENTLADACNVWDDGAALRFRPGVRKWLEQSYGDILDIFPKDGRRLLVKRVLRDGQVQSEVYGVYVVTRTAVLYFDGQTFTRVPGFAGYDAGAWQAAYDDYAFSEICVVPSAGAETTGADGGHTVAVQGSVVYLFGSGYFLTIAPDVLQWPFDSSAPPYADVFVTQKVPYVPTIYTDTPPAGGGTAGEARNFLTPQVTQCFTTDAASTIYRLTDSALDDASVNAVLQKPADGQGIAFYFDTGITSRTLSGFTVTLDRAAGTLTFGAPVGAGKKNNFSVTYSKTMRDKCPVMACHIAAWYGDADTKGVGSRLFLSGNADAPHIVYYSANENPNYFPDANLLPVGDPADAVTAFGSQFDILAVFKRYSVFSIDASAAQSYTVKLVHAGVGCDMPRSVALVNNTLVWGSTAGGLYRMHSTQIKDEKAVQAVGAPVLPAWRAVEAAALAQAGALCDGRYYYLFAGSTALAWHIESLQSDGTGGAFYLWKLPAALNLPLLLEGSLCAPLGAALYRFDADTVLDDGAWFAVWFETRAFDFGLPERQKVMDGLWADFAPASPARVRVRAGGQTQEWTVPAAGSVLDCRTNGEGTALAVRMERPANEQAVFALRQLVLRAREGRDV